MADIDNFTLDNTVSKTEWLVDNLIPLGHFSLFIAQAGVGKSFLIEQLAICVIYGQPFLGLDVIAGDVLLIDEDTPEKVLQRRLHRFMYKYRDIPRKGNLRLKSMTGLKLSDTNLITTLIENDDVKLVVIDSLNAICGEIDPNMTKGMSALQRFKRHCLHSGLTIVINHHISEKAQQTAHDLMSCNPHELAMGSSVINQQADSYYILGSPDTGSKLETLFVRPIGKRELIPFSPFKTEYIEETDMSYFTDLKLINVKKDLLDEVQSDIMALYREMDQGKPVGRTVKAIFDAMQQKHSVQSIRQALKQLEILGKLRCRKTRHNLFHYEVQDGKEEWPSPVENSAENNG
jgi:hypothetical protein